MVNSPDDFHPFSYGPAAFFPMASSLTALQPPVFPSEQNFKPVVELQRELMMTARIQPGQYTDFPNHLFPSMESVYDGLTGELNEKLAKIDAFDLCIRLYDRLEQFIGCAEGPRYLQAAGLLGGSDHQFSKAHNRAWEIISPYTESIRWLIEVAIKNALSSGPKASVGEFERLIAHAFTIFQWDAVWEHIRHGVVPHELTISDEYRVTATPTSRGEAAMKKHREDAAPYGAYNQHQWADINMRLPKTVPIQEMMRDSTFGLLDRPLQEERGYGTEDWLRFTCGVLDSFESQEARKVIRQDRLQSRLSAKWGVHEDRFDSLLHDYGLTKGLTDSYNKPIFPVADARRDSRLLRRPIVVLEKDGKPFCVYGVETTNIAVVGILDRLVTGRIGTSIMQSGGPLTTAVGTIQTNLGDAFRNRIAAICNDARFRNDMEKTKVAGESILQERGFGPVDVFVVDHQSRRFILVEAKDVADEGPVPRFLKGERAEFVEAMTKVQRQVGWFNARLNEIKSEYGIPFNEDYSVEGVVVVNSPRLWMYTEDEAMPVVDVKRFSQILKSGDSFLTYPVAQ